MCLIINEKMKFITVVLGRNQGRCLDRYNSGILYVRGNAMRFGEGNFGCRRLERDLAA